MRLALAMNVLKTGVHYTLHLIGTVCYCLHKSDYYYPVVSLHTELRNVCGVQERPCTWSTGMYVEYGKCTRSMGNVHKVCKMFTEYGIVQYRLDARYKSNAFLASDERIYR